MRTSGSHLSTRGRDCQKLGLWAARIMALLLLLAALAPSAVARPYFGDEVFTYRQPDGSTFGVRIYGDEFFAYERTADDNRQVIKDTSTGFWCYAKLSVDGRSFVSTGIPVVTIEKSSAVANKAQAIAAGAAEPFVMLPFDEVVARVDAAREDLDEQAREYAAIMGVPKSAEPVDKAIGSIVGLTILVDFPDEPGAVSQAEVARFLNQPSGYSDYGNACSVNEYFYIQSNGLLDYTNVVTPWITMPHPKAYYDDDSVNSQKPFELLQTARAILDAQGFDRSGFSVTNIYYAGHCQSGWRRGLWPHAGGSYQMTDMGDSPSLGTFCHENGHMICGFPDLYSYLANYIGAEGSSSIVGRYCLMAGGGGRHPANFAPILKINADWAEVVDLDYGDFPQRALLQVDRNYFYRYRNPDRPTEFFLLENRDDTTGYEGPYGGAGGANTGRGVVIWHVFGGGSNMYSTIQNPTLEEDERFTTPYYAFIIEANPPSGDPWYANRAPTPGPSDAFHAGQGADPVYSHWPLPGNPMFGDYDADDPLNRDNLSLSHPDLSFWNRDEIEKGRDVISGLTLHSFGEPGHFIPFIIGVNAGGTASWEVLAVTPAPSIGVTASAISARANWGQNPSNQSFKVFNKGKGALAFTVASNQPWLGVSPSSGYAYSVPGGETMTVSFSATGLAPGEYTGIVTVDSHQAAAFQIPVTLTIAEQSALAVSPAAPDVISVALDSDQSSKTVFMTVENTGGGVMKYDVATSAEHSPWNWLEPAFTSSLCVVNMRETVPLHVRILDAEQSPPMLPAGMHTGTVTISSAGAIDSPKTVTVELTVDGHIGVLSPNGGEVWEPNLDITVPIIWATNSDQPVSIELVKWDAGASAYVLVERIASDVPYDDDPDNDGRGRYDWSLPPDIQPSPEYRVRVFIGDSWNTATYRAMSDADFRIFRTAYKTDMGTNPGWMLEGDWAWGEPTGGGGGAGGFGNVSNPDPTSGYSGRYVVGYNLDGNYANNMPNTEYATVGPINCSYFEGTRLTFRRWLNVERTDNAVIEISTNGTVWHEVWSNSPNEDVTDGDEDEWTLVSYDISEYADNAQRVWLRWGMGPTDATYRFSGWNIDDVAVHGTYAYVGSLRVTLSPDTATGAQWRRVGTSVWLNSGAVEGNLPVGNYEIEFKDIGGHWVTPPNQNVTISYAQQTLATAQYYQAGSLRVTIEPSTVVSAGAQWRRTGTLAWFDSGATETDVPAGTHELEFSPVASWRAPTGVTVTVQAGATATATATYFQAGSIQVAIEPHGAVTAGAQWRRAGTGTWLNAGASENNVPIGSHTIEFKTVDGWITPQPIPVTLAPDQAVSVTGSYQKATGSLQVMIQPVAARQASAMWRRVATSTWHNSSYVEHNVPIGQYTVEFKTIAGWIAPSPMNVTVESDATATATGTYLEATGALRVTIEPEGARSGGAMWRRAESVTSKSEAEILSGNVFRIGEPALEDGKLAVPLLLFRGEDVKAQDTFTKDGLFTGGPAPAAFAFDVVYDPVMLSLSTGQPSAPDTQAAIQAVVPSDALQSWYGHELTFAEPDGPGTGRIRLEFSDPAQNRRVTTADNVREDGNPEDSENPFRLATLYFDWTLGQPAAAHLVIQNLTAVDGQETLASAAAESAHFKVDKGSAWLPSGTTESGLEPGTYIVEFKDVPGWATPGAANVEVVNNETATVTGVYAEIPVGALKVTLTPAEAVAAGAQWRRVGTENWRDSGVAEGAVPEGVHEVEFKSVDGWNTPANKAVTITADETLEATGEYTEMPAPGSLKVTIAPSGARNAGARWRRVGTATWRTSGTTETGVPAGSHTVEFKAISGWNEPAPVGVIIEPLETTEVTATYTSTGPGPGGCPFPIKTLQPFAESAVYEKVLPSVTDASGLQVSAPMAPLAVRLRANHPIAVDTVWGVVSWGDAESVEVQWLPIADADGWALFLPIEPWDEDQIITFSAGAYTVAGDEIGPFTYEFVADAAAYEGPLAVLESAQPASPDFVGQVYKICPGLVYTEPVTIQLPVPAGVDAGALEPAYLFTENGESRWVSGTRVLGWLEPESVRVVHDSDGTYIEFQVNHGGGVQLRRASAAVSSGVTNARISGDLLLFLALGAFLLQRTRRLRLFRKQ